MKVSIVVPTFNEEKDIARTLDHLLSLNYKNKEILVIDESSDRTPNIVKDYELRNNDVKYLRQTEKKGRCRARNQGILEASGEIVIILNADVCLPVDFIERIIPHYQNGADFLLVQSQVANMEYVFPRFVESVHRYRYPRLMEMTWTEGFSCRRRAALEVGLFEDDYPLPLYAGEDGLFGEKLEAKFKKACDESILVTHWVPYRFKDFWYQRYSRGFATPIFLYFISNKSVPMLFLRAVSRTFYYFMGLMLVLPFLRLVLGLTLKSNRKFKDFISFCFATLIDYLAAILGDFKGIFMILNCPNRKIKRPLIKEAVYS